MKMFSGAYLRLTGWYVLIIMAISLLFSGWVYNQARQELEFELGRFVARSAYTIPGVDLEQIVQQRLEDSRERLLIRLAGLNAVVLVLGAGASYWFARRTMRPIEESMEAQQRFTADASHELRTPLAAMKSEIEVGLRDKNMTKQEAVDLLRSNLEEIDRLGELSEGLLALTQADDAEPVVQPPVAVVPVVGKVVGRLRPLAQAKNIQIDYQATPVSVRADKFAVDKITGILVDNAIKYSPSGTTVHVRVYAKDGHGCIEVRDHGVGIKTAELAHIFERFYRADSSRSQSPGYGLGLSIAQKLAENARGGVTAASVAGKGSTFTAMLPAA